MGLCWAAVWKIDLGHSHCTHIQNGLKYYQHCQPRHQPPLRSYMYIPFCTVWNTRHCVKGGDDRIAWHCWHNSRVFSISSSIPVHYTNILVRDFMHTIPGWDFWSSTRISLCFKGGTTTRGPQSRHLYIYIYLYKYKYIYIYTYRHTYMYIYIHMYITSITSWFDIYKIDWETYSESHMCTCIHVLHGNPCVQNFSKIIWNGSTVVLYEFNGTL